MQGVANRRSICSKDGYNTGVNNFDYFGGQTWRIFAHELAHNFGAEHSFEDGKYMTGGIMDYGDGKLGGSYQFNTQYRKDQMCETINTHVQSCPQGFQSLEPACGNGMIDDGETCECSNKKKKLSILQWMPASTGENVLSRGSEGGLLFD